jgi:hypothetical protein
MQCNAMRGLSDANKARLAYDPETAGYQSHQRDYHTTRITRIWRQYQTSELSLLWAFEDHVC